MRVLLVEDHVELADTVATGLRREGIAVDIALDGHDALAHLALTDYDVLVLDRDIPGVHGDQICRSLVAEGRDGRILMLTAAGSIEDRVDGLSLGADDYLPKPFAFAELVARVRALARRSGAQLPPVLVHGDLRVDPANLVWRQNLAHERCLRGTLLARLGHPQQALAIAKAALEDEAQLAANPNASRLILSTAIEDLRSVEPVELRDPTRCLDFAQRNAAAGQQQEPYALYLLAMAYRQAGRLEEARAEAARALTLIAPPKGALVSYMRRELETIH